MSNVEFRSEFFSTDAIKPHCIASITAGIDGEIDHFTTAKDTLLGHGYDVVVYDYSRDVLFSGEPEYLPELVDEIHDDFANKAYSYERQRHLGASLGGVVALNMQWREQNAKTSILAAPGGPLSTLVSRHPIFTHIQPVWKQFVSHGYSRKDLALAWKDVDASPDRPPSSDKPIVAVVGKLDLIVPIWWVRGIEQAWRESGASLEVIEKYTDHPKTIKWFQNHLSAMLDAAAFLDHKVEIRN